MQGMKEALNKECEIISKIKIQLPSVEHHRVTTSLPDNNFGHFDPNNNESKDTLMDPSQPTLALPEKIMHDN